MRPAGFSPPGVLRVSIERAKHRIRCYRGCRPAGRTRSRRMLDVRSIWSQSLSIAGWLPGWLVGLLILLTGAIAALLSHLVLIGILHRLAGKRRFLAALVERTGAATRLALVVFVMSAALQTAPFDPAVRAAIAHALLIAFIVLVGWFSLIAVH